MDEDCNNMLDLYLANRTTTTLLESVWPDEYILSTSNNKMADDNVERDIQDLFDGVTNPEVDQDDDNASSRSWGEGPSTRGVKEITDQEIANLPVQELNKLLRNVPREEAARIRKRRRNLKNRGYSLSCRLRKQREQEDLINRNTSLKKQVEDGKWKLLKVWKEKEAYKRKYLQLQKYFIVLNQEVKTSESLPSR
ncbi:transcription factor MafB-like [Orbicella faveolata]|uniref:transcription factor MafB-like n=1 Tax=Orbicella faveolata TaxID=48498 RepID=UPI0009E1E538|nr:transcription factor MafB-like [Orbicella faveolata]